MNRKQADAILAKNGYALEVDKAEGVWYVVNAYDKQGKGITNTDDDACLHVVRLSQLDEAHLLYTAERLTKED